METDVLIVGGGPAGLATAIATRRKGLRVALVDSRIPPIDKACGEGLLPEGVASLGEIGIELDSSIAVPFRGIRFSDEHCSSSARFPRGTAFGVRRTSLHRVLVDRASKAGVSLLWGARLSDFDSERAHFNGGSIRYRWLVGADGQRSAVRRLAKLEPFSRGRVRYGFRRHYAVAPWTDLVEVYWGERCQLVVTPTGSDEVCISLFSPDTHSRIEQALAQFPEVAQRVCDTRPASSEAGAITALCRARGVARGNVALVGDASCTVDGIAGQGISLAFQESLALAEAFARGGLASYEPAHREITQTAARMTKLLLLMSSSSGLRRKVLRLLAAHPELFAKMISVHAGGASPEDLSAAAVLGLGWRVLWA